MSRERTHRVARGALLAALTLTLGWLETLLPPLPLLPPGAKPGLGNIVILYVLLRFGGRGALPLVLLKALFAFATRGAAAGLLSLLGGLLSWAVLCLLLWTWRERIGLAVLSVIGALSHNAGQLLGCVLLLQDTAVLWYAPALCLFGMAAGFVTAAVLKLCAPYIDRL